MSQPTKGNSMRMTTQLRRLLDKGSVLAASVFDPLSARLAELAGFDALHLTGYGVEATQIGAPDMGLISMSELVSHAARITAGINIPVLSDIDTGFGGANNIRRTISEMERAGVAGVHIEDQTFPKRCPVLDGRTVTSRNVAIGRINAALDARRDADFVIVARCDADVISIDEVIERSNLYLEAGADMAMPCFQMVDGRPYSKLTADEQMALFRRLTSGIRGRVMSLGVNPPDGYTAQEMGEAGFAFVMFAGAVVAAAANAMAAVLEEIKSTGTDAGYAKRVGGKYPGADGLSPAEKAAAPKDMARPRVA
jgi:methylisocitrate lyase